MDKQMSYEETRALLADFFPPEQSNSPDYTFKPQTINYHPIGVGMIDSFCPVSAKQIMEAEYEDIICYWEPYIYKGMITQINGMPGAGKTTLGYNLAVKAALGESFAGISLPMPLNVLYSDLETPKSLRQEKLIRVLQGMTAPDNLWFTGHHKIPEKFEITKDFIIRRNINLWFIDTRNELFDTRHEDDNAEAQQQYEYLKKLRDETGVSIVYFHHVGKKGTETKQSGVYSGRGASSRACNVDVVCTLSEEDDDTICLSKEKDRVYGGKEKLYLKKVGFDSFEVVDKPDIEDARQGEKAQELCLSYIQQETKTADLLQLAKENKIPEATLYRALATLTDIGKIIKVRKGVYTLNQQLSITSSLRDDSLIVDPKNEVTA